MCFENLISTSINTVRRYSDFNKFKTILYKFDFDKTRFIDFKKRNQQLIENNKNEYGYSKIKIFENQIFDIYAIFWFQNSESPYHDHSDNGCYYKVLDGILEETILNNNKEVIKQKNINNNIVGYMDNSIGYHKIKNIREYLPDSEDPLGNVKNKYEHASISIHAYSPPNYEANIIDTTPTKSDIY